MVVHLRSMTMSRLALLLTLLLAACAPTREGGEPAAAAVDMPPVAPPGATTVGERLGSYAFSTLIETALVPLHAGGAIDVRAQTCGGCHTDIHTEWEQTTHAAAMRDPQFVAELAKPDSPRWLCLSCHAPLQDQHPTRLQSDTVLVNGDEWSLGSPLEVPHEGYIPGFEAEAVTCASCHVRVDDDGHGTILGARGDTESPHRVRHAPDELRNVCARCHAPGDGELTPTFPCWFDTWDELQAGPHAGASCSSCHMPSVERPLALGGPPRTSVHHFWVGGGVPKDFATYDTLLDRQWQPGFDVAVTPVTRDADQWRTTITLTNTRGGHAIPTGDPERHLLIRATLTDATGEPLERWTHRIGQTWDWGDRLADRPASQTSDNRLLPGQTRELDAHVARHEAATHLVVDVLHVRLAPGNLRYAAQAEVDEQLLRQLPGARTILPDLQAHYPTFTVAFHEAHPLDGSPPTRTTRAERIAQSRAAQHWSVERLEQELGAGH